MNYIKLKHITPLGSFEYFRVSKRSVQDIEDEWEYSSHKDVLAESWGVSNFNDHINLLVIEDTNTEYLEIK